MFSHITARRCEGPATGRAFTLLELLVVISIITILVGIMLPAFNQIRIAIYNSRSVARVTELGMGAVNYANDHKGFFPGQHYPNRLMNTRFASDAWDDYNATGELRFTGGAVLAVSLFATNYVIADTLDAVRFRSNYASCSIADMGRIRNFNNSIWDRYPPIAPNTLPQKVDAWNAIAYWPATRGVTGLSQYKEVQNWWYTDTVSSNYLVDANYGDGTVEGTFCYVTNWGNVASPGRPATFDYTRQGSDKAQTAFEAFIKDKSLGGDSSTTPIASDRYIMMAAGVDRLFGTEDDIQCPVIGR